MHWSVLHGSGIDASFDPCVLLRPVYDDDGTIVDFEFLDANRAASEWIGLDTIDSLIGDRLLVRFPGQAASGAFEHYASVMDTGESFAADGVEFHRHGGDGPRTSLDVRAVRIGESLSLAWRDVSDRIRYQRALAESEAQFRMLAENASDVVCRTNPDGTVIWVSPSITAVLGWLPDEIVGRDIASFVEAADVERVLGARETVLGGETIESVECRVQSADGGWRWMSARAQPIWDERGTLIAAVVGVRDSHTEVTARRALTTLSAGNAILVRADHEQELLDAMCETAVRQGGYLHAWYGRKIDDAGRSVEMIASSVDHRDYACSIRLSWGDDPLGQGPGGNALRSREPVIVNDLREHAPFQPWRDAATERGFRSAIGLPVTIGGAIDGVLMVYAAEVDAFDTRAVGMLEDLAAQIGYGLEKLRDRASLDKALESAVDLLAAAVESRDPYTAGHQSRVAMLSVAIGREMGFDPHRLAGLDYGATVHDIGKIATPIEILTRPGMLAYEEMLLVRRHSVVGWEIASRFEWPWPINDMIHQHHERLDGSGYPQGLRGDEILLEARIIGVADTFEAMAYDRPYREARGMAIARHEIESSAGTLFDPDVVAAFVRVLDGGFTFGAPSRP